MGTKIFTDKDSAILMNTVNSTGVFVTCGTETPNIMVTHGGAVGKLWGRHIFALPVKSSKYSYQIICKTKSFALNVPARDMRTEIALCDTISGFKCNKFETLGLHPKRAHSIDSYILGECGLIIECKVIARIPPEAVTPETEKLFDVGRAHTLFIGEIADSYKLR